MKQPVAIVLEGKAYWTLADAARYFRVKHSTLKQAALRATLPSRWHEGLHRRLVDPQDVARYLTAARTGRRGRPRPGRVL